MRELWAAVLAIPFAILHLTTSAHSANVPAPEVFLRDSRNACVQRVFLQSPSDRERQGRLLNFLDAAFAETDGWRRLFAVASIDYEGSAEFSLVMYNGCDLPPNLTSNLRRNFGRYSIKIVHGSTLIDTKENLYRFKNGLQIFERYNRADSLENCLIRVPIIKSDSEMEASLLADAVWHKYALPIIDITWRNADLFFLMSHDCSKRPQMFQLFLRLADHANFPVRDVLGPPAYSGNAKQYRAIASQ